MDGHMLVVIPQPEECLTVTLTFVLSPWKPLVMPTYVLNICAKFFEITPVTEENWCCAKSVITDIRPIIRPENIMHSAWCYNRGTWTKTEIRLIYVDISVHLKRLSQLPDLFIGTSGTPIEYVILFCWWSVPVRSFIIWQWQHCTVRKYHSD